MRLRVGLIMSEFEYKEEYSWLTNACLNLTDDCCLACRYCFVEQHPHYMSYDVAQTAVLYLLDNLEKKNKKFGTDEKANITYFGGEPTLMWDEIIVPLTNWIRKENFPINLNITTNGVLLNKERIQFLKDNEIYPLLSIDGNRETQEFNRPCHNLKLSSFDLIKENIPLLLEAFPNITFRGTIYSKTADKTFQNYIFAIEQGFKNVFFMPDCRHAWSEAETNNLLNELDKIFAFNTELFRKNIVPIGFSAIDDMYKCFFNKPVKTKNVKRNIQRCGLGITMGAIGWDGSIFSCQEQPSSGKNNIFYIGDLKNGIIKERHNNLLKRYSKQAIMSCEDKSYCENCLLKDYCIGFNCPSSSYDLYKSFFIDSKIHCLWQERMFSNCITTLEVLLKEKNNTFITYVKEVLK